MMLIYLVKSAWRVFKVEGIKSVVNETLRYLKVYGSPREIIIYWYNRLRGKSWVLKDVQGSKMWLNYQYKGIHTDLILNRIRELKPTAYMQTILQSVWTVVDIGANIGYYALMEARVCKKVYAIEPEVKNCELLLKNVLQNGYQNIEVVQAAVGDRDGEAELEISSSPNWHKIKVGNNRGVVIVPMIKLDSYIGNKKVDFVRMDTEGYELNILKGMENIIKQNNLGMFIETHNELIKEYGGSLAELYKFLASYNFILTYSVICGMLGPTGYMRDLLSDKRLYLGLGSWLFLKKGD